MTFPTTSLVFDPVRLLILIGWFYLGFFFVQRYASRSVVPLKWKPLSIVLLLLIGLLYFPVLVGLDVRRRVRCGESSVGEALRSSLGLGKIGDMEEPGGLESSIILLDTNGRSLSEVFTHSSDNAALLRLTGEIIGTAVTESASDILIHPSSENHCNLRYRVDGHLRIVRQLTESESKAVINSIKAISGMDIAERRRPQDGAFIARTPAGSISFRVATAGVLNGEKVSIRVLDQSADQHTLQNIGLLENERRMITDMIANQSGMVLVCGPTGSGKSTTLHAVLRTINCVERNVITIEDPIEYVLPEASQIEINAKAGITFSKALRSVLRQDPDVICVGEIRDTETAEIALQASQTGHLVFATVHSGSNTSALLRLIDLGIRPLLIASALNLVISQRLVRRLCDHCKSEVRSGEERLRRLTGQKMDSCTLFGPVGCDKCNGTGYRGRTGVFDFMVMDGETKARLSQGDISIGAARDDATGTSDGSMNMLQVQGVRLTLAGITSLDEVSKISTSLD